MGQIEKAVRDTVHWNITIVPNRESVFLQVHVFVFGRRTFTNAVPRLVNSDVHADHPAALAGRVTKLLALFLEEQHSIAFVVFGQICM